MLRQAFVDHHEVGRHQVPGGQIVVDQLANEGPGFFQRGLRQQIVQIVVRIERRIRRRPVDAAKIQPVIEESIREIL